MTEIFSPFTVRSCYPLLKSQERIIVGRVYKLHAENFVSEAAIYNYSHDAV